MGLKLGNHPVLQRIASYQTAYHYVLFYLVPDINQLMVELCMRHN
jgi:hypothetical protein